MVFVSKSNELSIQKGYEEQGILEDGDTDHRDGADSTDDNTGSERLRYVAHANGELRIEN